MEYRIGIDIGGTKVNLGIVDEQGTIITQIQFPSAGARDIDTFAFTLKEKCEKITQSVGIPLVQIGHIGVGIPGTVDTKTGVVELSVNLFGNSPVPLGKKLERLFGKPVTIVQDSWAGTFAEYRFGQRQQVSSMLCVTLGTGVGCGIVINGRVYAGTMHSAGEIGHTAIERGGNRCNCKQRGCLETYVSGTAIGRRGMELFGEKMKTPRAEAVFELAYAGDSDALALIEKCRDELAYGLAMLVNILSIDHIVISGGLCVHDELLIKPLKACIESYGYPSWTRQNKLKVCKAILGPDAPMIGAAFLTQADML